MPSVPTSSAEIREAYLKFFESKGCQRWPSSSLIPDDPSLLLTVAGMVQFKAYFLQQKHLDSRYIGTTTAQKCVRTNDIDIIGTDGRHLSFFEMMGNFSFGAYFKEEMCAWAYEFSVDVLGLDPQKIYATIYEDDEETARIWEKVGIPAEHISRLGADDNFWVAGPTGPCGPCSELYFDLGPDVGCGRSDCAPGCDCDRFLEYWNLVFTQYDRHQDGTMTKLEKKNIDTGLGLERMAAIMQHVTSNFDTDILRDLVAVGERISGKSYGDDDSCDLSLRIMADHSRSIVFMIGDGVLPSNEGRGYVLRHLIRRAVRHGRLQGIDKPFLVAYLDKIVERMGDVYPEIVENRSLIEKVLLSEERRFAKTIVHGEIFLNETLEGLNSGETLDGFSAFTLHDTYGFPFELTEEICAERGIEVDKDGFERAMQAQRERARNARDDEAWSGFGNVFTQILDSFGETEFVGYAKSCVEAKVIAIVKDGQTITEAASGDEVALVLDITPFYGEMGGQVGDTGTISTEQGARLEVKNTVKPEGKLTVHMCTVVEGIIRTGQAVTAAIDTLRRARIARNHTATHILQRALVQELGDHVKQAGSLVAPDRLRFDFTHFEQMHHDQILAVERICNKVIMSDLPVRAYETSLSAAREAGVTALFGEKYGEFVRVIEVGSFSKELCGGTHVGRSSEIGLFKIVQETSIGASTRRIEAVTSLAAYKYMSGMEEELRETARFLGVSPLDVSERVTKMDKQLRNHERIHKQRAKMAAEGDIADLIKGAADLGTYRLVVADMHEASVADLRGAWDIAKRRMMGNPFAVVMFSRNPENGKPLMLAAGNDGALKAGFNANDIIKQIAPQLGGRGGGKPAMAQAGGRDAHTIPGAIAKVKEIFGA